MLTALKTVRAEDNAGTLTNAVGTLQGLDALIVILFGYIAFLLCCHLFLQIIVFGGSHNSSPYIITYNIHFEKGQFVNFNHLLIAKKSYTEQKNVRKLLTAKAKSAIIKLKRTSEPPTTVKSRRRARCPLYAFSRVILNVYCPRSHENNVILHKMQQL